MTNLDREALAQALYSAHVQHVMHAYSYTNRQIADEIATAYENVLRARKGETDVQDNPVEDPSLWPPAPSSKKEADL